MKPTRKGYWLVASAVAQVLTISFQAVAQVPAQQDGRALDANNRLGSGGYNQANRGQAGVSPNQIIYGDVTGGKQFRGPVAARDPYAFTGPSPGMIVDRFVAGSAGVPQPYQPSYSLAGAQPFYGQSRNVPPPAGTERLGFTGGYVGTSLAPQSELSMHNFVPDYDAYLAQQLGTSTPLINRNVLLRNEPGDLYLQGPLEGENRAILFTGSPLYGVRLFRPDQETTGDIGLQSLYGPSSLYPDQASRFRYDPQEVQRLRFQMEATQGFLQPPGQPPGKQQPGGPQQPGNQQGNQPQNPAQPPDLTESARINDQSVNGAINDSAQANGMNTGEASRQRSTLLTPEQQSQQYNELKRRFQRSQNPELAAIEAEHQAQLERQARARRQNQPPTSRPASGLDSQSTLRRPAGAGAGAGATGANRMGAVNLPPMKITSLATGMRASGVRDLLKSAEDLMRQGKFQSAIDKYNLALQAVPNNPLVLVGRANAELGAGFYRQASADLHRVFLSDQATLMAQYDLNAWIPSERMQFIIKDLKALDEQNPKDETPAFLLAYIYYNTGDAPQAARYLGEAQQRAGQADPLLNILRARWRLPQAQMKSEPTKPEPAPDLNK